MDFLFFIDSSGEKQPAENDGDQNADHRNNQIHHSLLSCRRSDVTVHIVGSNARRN